VSSKDILTKIFAYLQARYLNLQKQIEAEKEIFKKALVEVKVIGYVGYIKGNKRK
jgi:hypothetical protein